MKLASRGKLGSANLLGSPPARFFRHHPAVVGRAVRWGLTAMLSVFFTVLGWQKGGFSPSKQLFPLRHLNRRVCFVAHLWFFGLGILIVTGCGICLSFVFYLFGKWAPRTIGNKGKCPVIIHLGPVK